MVAFDNLY